MKTMSKLVALVLVSILVACGGKDEKKKASFSYEKKATTTQKVTAPVAKEPASKTINLTDKGVGPITSVTLSKEIDQTMVAHGQEIYNKMCTACHRPNKKFIGPAQAGVLERRTPEWVMNMILNPEGMLQKDALAKELLAEFNGAPMANQNLTKEEARAVLEYFRTLK